MRTSRECVLTAFAHEEPDRVPVWCGASPEFIAKAKRQLGIADTEHLFVRFGDDFRRVRARYAGPKESSPDWGLSPGATYGTPFGVERGGFGYGMPKDHPLAGATLKQVYEYPGPDPEWMEVTPVRAHALAWNRRYVILGGDGRFAGAATFDAPDGTGAPPGAVWREQAQSPGARSCLEIASSCMGGTLRQRGREIGSLRWASPACVLDCRPCPAQDKTHYASED